MNRARLMSVVLAAYLFLSAARGARSDPAIKDWSGAYEIYTIRSGDTLQNIAARYNVSADLSATLFD